MHKTLTRIKSTILSGIVAVSAFAAPLAAPTATVAPSLTANAAGGTDDYAKLLQYSLYFYDANMCGNISSKTGLSWRGNCHTSDEVTGGFHDAGDHAMFGLPQGYTASTLGWSYYEFKDAYLATGQGDHLKLITDHFCDFFKRSTKMSGGTVTSLLYQKGNGDDDHDYWGAPENQTGSRRMYWSNNGASDIAAQYAAALAFNYMNFGNKEDLTYAEALYKFSTQYNQVATEGLQSRTGDWFYKNSSCQDEQAWAAAALYLATNNQSYLSDAQSKVTQYLGWVHGWENSDLGAACLIAEATNNWGKVNNWITSTTQQKTQNGYYFLDKWGSARLNCSMQFTALVASKHSNADHTTWAKGQMDYITGNNPSGYSFVVGIGSKYPQNAHHRAASGYSSYAEMGDTTQAKSGSPTLIGALVGGPSDSNGTYQDSIKDYVCNEVALDYNAGLVGAAAGLYSKYGTGSTVSKIDGVTKIYSGSSSINTGTTTTTTYNDPYNNTTTTTTVTPDTGDIVLLPSDMNVDTEKGSDGGINNFAEFAPQGAKSATLYLKVNSNDTEVSGAFGTWNGDWFQEDFTGVKVGANKEVTVDYTIPSNVGSTVKAMVFWPHGDDVTIEKVVLHKGGSSSATTTTSRTTSTTSRTTTTTTSTPVNNDIVLLPSDMNVDTEKGSDGGINNFAEFAPQGAKSATLYLKVNSNDTEVSGAFGTWNGDWFQEDFTGVKVGANKEVTVDYTIPSNVGSTVKAMVFWPHGDDVTIEKVVLHKDGSSATTTTTSRTTTTTTTTSTTTTTDGDLPAPKLYGDADDNGEVKMNDVVLIMQVLANNDKYGLNGTDSTHIKAQGRANADCHLPGNGLSVKDAQAVQKKILGIGTLPAYD